MVVSVARVNEKHLLAHSSAAESPEIREQVIRARERQHKRNHGLTNAELSSKNIATTTLLSKEGTALLNMASERMKLSARSYFKVIKVARTIADLAGCPDILAEHMAEALQYRQKNSEIH
jgi:magnesium chelatase family protein